jgi:hypothetical protein
MVDHFFNNSVSRHPWQLQTDVFLNGCLIHSVLLVKKYLKVTKKFPIEARKLPRKTKQFPKETNVLKTSKKIPK